jgi:DNA-binding IclR family transcriptional regulator
MAEKILFLPAWMRIAHKASPGMSISSLSRASGYTFAHVHRIVSDLARARLMRMRRNGITMEVVKIATEKELLRFISKELER